MAKNKLRMTKKRRLSKSSLKRTGFKNSRNLTIRSLNHYHTLTINRSFRNIFFSLWDYRGNLIFKFSSGLLNIKDKIYRFDSYSISKIARAIFKFFKKNCYGHLKLKFKNCEFPLISSVLKSLGNFKYFIFIIDLLVLKPHNGMRLKKQRRL